MNFKNRTSYYLVPLFMVVYFSIALFPVLTKTGSEIFPFFSFKLFSKIPNGFERYDIVFDLEKKQPHFLLYKNDSLDNLEIQYYNNILSKVAKQIEATGKVDRQKISRVLEYDGSITLVKMKGDYIEIYKDGKYDLEVIKKIKE